MPARRREIEVSIERPLGAEGSGAGTVRLTARLELDADGNGPPKEELARELERLRAEMEALVGPPRPTSARTDRPLDELVETYRPRGRELVDLLRADGELTEGEHTALLEHVATTPAPVSPGSGVAPSAVAAPLPASAPERGGERGAGERIRSVAELLTTYGIASLRQAGAVRARRQISFSEYMALKKHFESPSDEAPVVPSDRPAR